MRTSAITIITTLLVTFTGCRSTQYIPVETLRTERIRADTTQFMNIINTLTDRLRRSEHTTDSLIRNHKTNVTVNEQGDTVRIKETEYIYISSNREHELEKIVEAKNDSLRDLRQQLLSAKTDSVQVPYPVERRLTRWQQAKMDLGGIAMGALALTLTLAACRLIRKHRPQPR
ncbi:MAG: hypothetical protein Q4F07_06840 [Bacteroidales bacterium]|nr:hypothetical protein [Bacteroidales bacterium]